MIREWRGKISCDGWSWSHKWSYHLQINADFTKLRTNSDRKDDGSQRIQYFGLGYCIVEFINWCVWGVCWLNTELIHHRIFMHEFYLALPQMVWITCSKNLKEGFCLEFNILGSYRKHKLPTTRYKYRVCVKYSPCSTHKLPWRDVSDECKMLEYASIQCNTLEWSLW